MILKILKEWNTWMLGTSLFIGFAIGAILQPIKIESASSMILVLLIICWLLTVLLVALIKWQDRFIMDW